jgi:hypothetical protein
MKEWRAPELTLIDAPLAEGESINAEALLLRTAIETSRKQHQSFGRTLAWLVGIGKA